MKQTNHSLAVFLINKDVRGIQCVFSSDPDDKHAGKYLYKSFDQSLQKGDVVIVPGHDNAGFSVVTVAAVNVEPDFDTGYEYKWIVAKLDKTEYERTLELEKSAIAKIKEAEKLAKRKELAAKMLDLNAETLKQLPLYKNGDSDVNKANEARLPEYLRGTEPKTEEK